jgi:hypothetical protein
MIKLIITWCALKLYYNNLWSIIDIHSYENILYSTFN